MVCEIIVHEADEPNAVVNFLDAEFLTGEHGRDISFFLCRQMRPPGNER